MSYRANSEDLKGFIRQLASSAVALRSAIETGVVSPDRIPPDQLGLVTTLSDPPGRASFIIEYAATAWGTPDSAIEEAREDFSRLASEIDRLTKDAPEDQYFVYAALSDLLISFAKLARDYHDKLGPIEALKVARASGAKGGRIRTEKVRQDRDEAWGNFVKNEAAAIRSAKPSISRAALVRKLFKIGEERKIPLPAATRTVENYLQNLENAGEIATSSVRARATGSKK